ncbi:poly [ADP-ribose] polymerase tankyrase-1-like isoform X1 [Schistocerca nitens]|uniref:poly [ADP-ribose] polymerase tankyrase-1-like isoform X1 n=2 Tax=Schistocerca nitens TaxID=7011 RepID=UPI002117EF4C|nr:poly [ADP-ribose] polymerase tankyrase-1-like isoform X1 [Schistocerca nitens]
MCGPHGHIPKDLKLDSPLPPDNEEIVMAVTSTQDHSIVTDLRTLLESGEGADVKLVVGGSELLAHSPILTARSPVFAAMLRNNMKEAHSRQIEITDLQEDVLKQLLCFMYTDTAPQLASMLGEMIAAADKYDLPSLKEKCEEQIAQGLSVENAAAAALLAVLHSCPRLESAAVAFIATHPEVMTSAGWINVLLGNAEAAAQICGLVAAATPRIRASSVEQTQDLAEKMIVAAKAARVDELQRLLGVGAPVDARDNNGYTVLHLAVMNAGAESARRGRANTYAQVAAYTGAETVKCLLDAGASANVKDKSLQTPLHAAAYRGDVKIMWTLLTASARVDVKDRWGKTPLHWAAATDNIEAVRALLLAGANKDIRDHKGLLPIDVATAFTRELFSTY